VADGEFELKDKLLNKLSVTYPAIIHGNGKTDMTEIYKLIDVDEFHSIDSVTKLWQPTIQYNQQANKAFIEKVKSIPKLKEHRDWVEKND